jgi:predicted HicB family RNase H-like nuclease
VEGLRREFRTSVDDYLEFCSELGREPERPYSGRFVVRIDPDLHRDAAWTAHRMGLSLDAWCVEAFERFRAECDAGQAGSGPAGGERRRTITRRSGTGLETR